MTLRALGRTLGGTVDIDVCGPCHLLWFDPHESLALSARGVIDLFDLLRAAPPLTAPPPAPGPCPRCPAALRRSHNLVAGGERFTEHRCPQGHGRLLSFAAFLIEKGFARALTRAEVAALQENARPLACSGCGATLDLRTDARCLFCGLPATLLDPLAVESALRRLQAQDKCKAKDPAVAAADRILLHERLRVEEQRGAIQRLSDRLSAAERTGVVDLLSLSAEVVFGLFGD